MRPYAKFAPTFWTGPTGRAIRAAGRDAQVLACYLFTCPSSNMLGLYYLPLPTLCHEAGYTAAEARATLAALGEIGFAHYDEDRELVWVVEAGRYQVADELKPNDKRVKGIVRQLEAFGGHQYARSFYSRYREAFSLPDITFRKALPSPLLGAMKPLRSHKKEQEQEQEQKNGNPPNPPAAQGGANGSDPATAKRAIEEQVEKARRWAIDQGHHPLREHRRKFREWFKAGYSMAEVQAAIERGDHLHRPPL